jgi:hypothetical protein
MHTKIQFYFIVQSGSNTPPLAAQLKIDYEWAHGRLNSGLLNNK